MRVLRLLIDSSMSDFPMSVFAHTCPTVVQGLLCKLHSVRTNGSSDGQDLEHMKLIARTQALEPLVGPGLVVAVRLKTSFNRVASAPVVLWFVCSQSF